MRKRKRDYGTFLDEDTGEIITVQTTKAAKRDHRKHGKWYKEPTSQEIRIWDREEKRQAAAEKAARREENKKVNAAKRSEQIAKDIEQKQRLYEAGKITFTQTLAKKDEDQRNLHSWFGGKPAVRQQSGRDEPAQSNRIDEHSDDKALYPNKGDVDANGQASCMVMYQGKVSDTSDHQQLPLVSDAIRVVDQQTDRSEISSEFQARNSVPSCSSPKTVVDAMDQLTDQDLDLLDASIEFEIAEDSGAETEVPTEEIEPLEPNSNVDFKVPALPAKSQRQPLSPISESELNVRDTQNLRISSFPEKVSKIDNPVITNSQAVRDLLSGLCTQDLALDIDEELEDDDKENTEPRPPSGKGNSPTKATKTSPLRQVANVSDSGLKISFNSFNESFNYDEVFAELNAEGREVFDEDFDEDLDDATFLSLPATQIIASARKAAVTALSGGRQAVPQHTPPVKFDESVRPAESFGIEGLDDEDLIDGLKEYEKSHQERSNPSISIGGKKKRILPWEKQGWDAFKGADYEGTDDGEIPSSQRTELLTSQG